MSFWRLLLGSQMMSSVYYTLPSNDNILLYIYYKNVTRVYFHFFFALCFLFYTLYVLEIPKHIFIIFPLNSYFLKKF